MRLSYPAGFTSILREEGVILVTYDDGTGVLTIGGGHTTAAGPPAVIPGMHWTLEQALLVFGQDIARVEVDVGRAVKVPITQAQFDALVSFHYNTGGLFRSQLLKQINSGDMSGAGFMGWTRAGNDPNMLRGRRLREQAMFLRGDYGDISGISVWDHWPGHPTKRPLPPVQGAPQIGAPPVVEGGGHSSPVGSPVVQGAPAAPIPDVPGTGPVGPPPIVQSTTVWASISMFLASGGGMVLSYLQYLALPIVITLVVGGLAAWIVYQRYQHKQLHGV